jgi:hypothetical protein
MTDFSKDEIRAIKSHLQESRFSHAFSSMRISCGIAQAPEGQEGYVLALRVQGESALPAAFLRDIVAEADAFSQERFGKSFDANAHVQVAALGQVQAQGRG